VYVGIVWWHFEEAEKFVRGAWFTGRVNQSAAAFDNLGFEWAFTCGLDFCFSRLLDDLIGCWLDWLSFLLLIGWLRVPADSAAAAKFTYFIVLSFVFLLSLSLLCFIIFTLLSRSSVAWLLLWGTSWLFFSSK